jgi:hypothetical protein
MPILGIIASQNYSRVTDTGAMFPIAMVNVGSAGAATITFSSIPQTYKHLQIRYLAKNATTSGTDQSIYTQFNGDTGSNYAWHRLYGYNTSVSADNSTSQTQGFAGFCITSTSGYGGMYSVGILDILDYTSTTKNKTSKSLTGSDGNSGFGDVGLTSSLWFPSTPAAITSINLVSSADFVQYSQFALFGIKG